MAAFLQSHEDKAEKYSISQWFIQFLIFHLRFNFSTQTILPQIPGTTYYGQIYLPSLHPLVCINIGNPLNPMSNVAKSMCRIEEMRELFRAVLLGIGSGHGCHCPGNADHAILEGIFSAVIGVAMSSKISSEYE